MLLRLEVSDSDWWEASLVLVRSGEEVELTGEEPRPVLLVTLHLPVLPVPTLPRPLSDFPPPTTPPFLLELTRLLLPWLPLISSSGPPARPLVLDLDFGMDLLAPSPSTGAWLLVLLARAFFTFLNIPPDSLLLGGTSACC